MKSDNIQKQQQNTEAISLRSWPKKPLRGSVLRISPISSKVIESSGIAIKDILPVSVTDYLGSSLLNEDKNLDELLYRFHQFNQGRQIKVERLKHQRQKFQENSNIHNIHLPRHSFQKSTVQHFQCNTASAKKIKNAERISHYENDEDNHQKFELKKSKKSYTLMQTNSPENVKQMISMVPMESYPPPVLTKSIYSPHKQNQNQNDTKKAQNLILSRHKSSTNLYLNSNNNNTDPTIPKFELMKKFQGNSKKKYLFAQESQKVIKKKTQKNAKIKSKQKKLQQYKSIETKVDYYGSSPRLNFKKSQMKSSTSKSKKINSPIKAKKTDRKQRFTQRPNIYYPLDEYYDSTSTQQLQKRTTVLQPNIYMLPIFEQLTSAVDQLIELTQKQQIQIQMVQNLSIHDHIEEKEKKRLMKIHQIQRDQLKSHVYVLKDKIKELKKTGFVGIMNTL